VRALKAAAALLFCVFCVSAARAAEPARRVPTVDDLLNVRSVGGAQISPDGARVAYTVSAPDFKQDAFVTQVWLAGAATGESVQLTRGEKSSTSPRWSPDGQWVAFLSNRSGDKNQVFAIRIAGGEAAQLTKSETAVSAFEWSRDGKSIAFMAPEADAQARKDRKEHLADYEVVRKDYAFVHIFTLDVEEALKAPVKGKQRTKGTEYSVGSFSWSPDGSRIAFSATKNPDLIQGVTSDVYVLALAGDTVKKIVAQPGSDTGPEWSPDGKQIAFNSLMGETRSFAKNNRIALVPAEGGPVRSISDAFDENANLIAWVGGNIYFSASQKTASHLFRLDPATGSVARVSSPDALIGSGFSLSRDARRVAFTAGSPTSLPEVFVSDAAPFAPRAVTKMTEQASGFLLGSREVVSWKSQDGATIEGVLIKPADFDPKKKYPLLCIIHGGPTGVDRPVLLQPDSRYYPSDIWAARGALILKVNYRGSAGYGEKFRRLNERNLGVGDAWDVLSGVDFLIGKGWVDPARVGCMGWSQGGYISAFLTTSTTRFAAISDGAGISDWATYYYNTDITPFTINYLGADPVEDPEIYRKTSPITYVKGAKTPTLIQHGENDKRVPIANAYELRQALEDRGVPVEMVVYKGFGHGITKPKSQRAVMSHNLAWFNHYIFGDPAPDLPHPDVPKKEKDKDKDKDKDEEKKD
jgi:dipeptidyl aminopeptidase/acylaminoacyl peptidase